MVKNIVVTGILCISLGACTSSEANSDAANNKDKKENVKELTQEPKGGVDANRVLTMELEGMVCSMGCGGSIRKELRATGAIADCDFDFEDERPVDVATIEFDKNKISVDKIVEIVSEINNGQFTVGKTTSEVLEKVKIIESTSSSSNSSSSKVKVSSSFHSPNIFDLFSGLLSF